MQSPIQFLLPHGSTPYSAGRSVTSPVSGLSLGCTLHWYRSLAPPWHVSCATWRKLNSGCLSQLLTSFSLLNHSKLNLDKKNPKQPTKKPHEDPKTISKGHVSSLFKLPNHKVSSKKPFYAHTCTPIQPFKPSLASPFLKEELQFQVEKQTACIYSLVLPFSHNTQIHEQDSCTAICLLHGIAFPFSWSGESSLLLSLPCSQRPSPVFVPQSIWWGSAALVLCFRRLIYTLPLGIMEDSPSACTVCCGVRASPSELKLLLDEVSWNSWPSFSKSCD